MEEKQLSGQESLALINEMISKAKHEIKDDGKGWLIWGGMIFLAAITTYIIAVFKLPVSLWIGWNAFGIIAILLMVYSILKPKKTPRAKTYVDELLRLFDIGFTVCIFIIIISININQNPSVGFGYFLMVYAFLMLIEGGALRFKPLLIGAVVNWLGAIAIFLVEDFKYDMLITAGAVFIGYIIPGLMLRSQYRKRLEQGLSR
ncbi:MAG TPA: hypothetical protein VFZ47_10805 [Chitinophagaceae bacterium]